MFQHIVNVQWGSRRIYFTADKHWSPLIGSNTTSFSGLSIVGTKIFHIGEGGEDDTEWIVALVNFSSTIGISFPDDPVTSVGWNLNFATNLEPGVLESALLAALDTPGLTVDTDLVGGGDLTSAALNSATFNAYAGPIASVNGSGFLTGRLNDSPPDPTFIIVDPPE